MLSHVNPMVLSRFPKMGVPLVIIHFRLGLSLTKTIGLDLQLHGVPPSRRDQHNVGSVVSQELSTPGPATVGTHPEPPRVRTDDFLGRRIGLVGWFPNVALAPISNVNECVIFNVYKVATEHDS